MADRLRTRGSVRTAVIWRSVRVVLTDLAESSGRDAPRRPRCGRWHRRVSRCRWPSSATRSRSSTPVRIRSLPSNAGPPMPASPIGSAPSRATPRACSRWWPPASFDVVVLHSVLEVVDDPAAALGGGSGALRPGGVVSVVAANRLAAVLHRAAAGRFDEALHALRDPLGRYSATDPAPRRFMLADLEALLDGAGLAVVATHGSRVFADLVPGGALDADPAAVEALIALEFEASELPAFRDIATQLHVVGRRV